MNILNLTIQNHLQKWANQKMLITVLKVACICLFASRAYEYFFREVPLSEVLSGSFGSLIINFIAITYLFCAYSAFKISKLRSIHSLIILWGVLNLGLLTWAKGLVHPHSIVMLVELTLQWCTPLFLLWAVHKPGRNLALAFKVAIALTFTGHGIFAVGLFPTPATFITMVINLTPINSVDGAMVFLKVAGIMDFIISVGIFIPVMSMPSLAYAAVWGIFTAFARVAGFFNPAMLLESISVWLHETIMRFPHGLVPFGCILLVMYMNKQVDSKNNIIEIDWQKVRRFKSETLNAVTYQVRDTSHKQVS